MDREKTMISETLEELYHYYFRRVRQDQGRKNDLYEAGKDDGALEVLGALYLSAFGGRAMYRLWQETMEDCRVEEAEARDWLKDIREAEERSAER